MAHKPTQTHHYLPQCVLYILVLCTAYASFLLDLNVPRCCRPENIETVLNILCLVWEGPCRCSAIRLCWGSVLMFIRQLWAYWPGRNSKGNVYTQRVCIYGSGGHLVAGAVAWLS